MSLAKVFAQDEHALLVVRSTFDMAWHVAWHQILKVVRHIVHDLL